MQDLTIIPASNAALPDAPVRLLHWIGGAWVDSADGATSERRSPAHGIAISVAAKGGRLEAEAAIAAARAAFDAGDWARSSGKDRATLLLRVADLIDRDRAEIARHEVMESGKPITQALAEIEGAADLWRYAAALARTMHGDSHNSLGPDMLGLVLKEPIGVVSLICPWNFPFLIVSQKLPFALAAGCTAVVKPSELTPGTTVMLGKLLQEAGLPAVCATSCWAMATRWGGAVVRCPRGHGQLHRLDRGGQTDRGGGQRDAEEGEPRTGRQEPAGNFSRCRSGSGSRCHRLRGLFQRGRMLQFRQPDHRA